MSLYDDIRLSSSSAGLRSDLFPDIIQARAPSVSVDTNVVSTIPAKQPIWGALGSLVNTGLSIWKNVETIKTAKVNTPYQIVQQPAVVSIPDRSVITYQPQSQLSSIDPISGLKNIFGALEAVSQAPRMVQQAEQITTRAQYTGWIIAGALVFLGVMLIASARR